MALDGQALSLVGSSPPSGKPLLTTELTMWQGEQDVLLPIRHARRPANELSNCTLRAVASSGHHLPSIIADVVLDDLAPR